LKQPGIPNPSRKEYFPIHNANVMQPSALSALNVLGVATVSRR